MASPWGRSGDTNKTTIRFLGTDPEGTFQAEETYHRHGGLIFQVQSAGHTACVVTHKSPANKPKYPHAVE